MVAPTSSAEAPANRSVRDLKNIGPKLEQYLAAIGIATEMELREKGVVQTYKELGLHYPHLVNRMALYALYGALSDQHCMKLPPETKN